MSTRPDAWLSAIFFHWLPLLLWMSLIYWLSDQPALPHPGRRVGLSDYVVDYAAHAFTFGLLTILIWRAVRASPWSSRRRLLWRVPIPVLHLSALLATLYAASDEIHQHFVPGRWAKVTDWLADLAGILLAAGALWLWQRSGRHARHHKCGNSTVS